MFGSRAIWNSVRTTILHNVLKGYSWGFLREWAIGQKPLLFWAIFTLKYKTNDIWTKFFLCLEYFTGKISWISLNIDVLDTLKHHFNLKCPYNKTIFWRLHAIVPRDYISNCLSITGFKRSPCWKRIGTSKNWTFEINPTNP